MKRLTAGASANPRETLPECAHFVQSSLLVKRRSDDCRRVVEGGLRDNRDHAFA